MEMAKGVMNKTDIFQVQKGEMSYVSVKSVLSYRSYC